MVIELKVAPLKSFWAVNLAALAGKTRSSPREGLGATSFCQLKRLLHLLSAPPPSQTNWAGTARASRCSRVRWRDRAAALEALGRTNDFSQRVQVCRFIDCL